MKISLKVLSIRSKYDVLRETTTINLQRDVISNIYEQILCFPRSLNNNVLYLYKCS